MWIILLYLCVCVVLPNTAQNVTSFETETATETYTKSGVNVDSSQPPVIITIRDGRNEKLDKEISRNIDRPLFYSNQWQPILMPLGYSGNRDTEIYASENEPSVDHLFVPTFLRRPDSEQNQTPYNYLQLAQRHELSNVPVLHSPVIYLQSDTNLTSDYIRSSADQIPIEPLPHESSFLNAGNIQNFESFRNFQNFIAPGTSFPGTSQFNLNLNTVNAKLNTDPQRISPTAITETSKPNLTIDRIYDESEKSLPIDTRYKEKDMTKPDVLYRNGQRFFSPVVPAYYPRYPVLPFQRNGIYQPIVPYSSNIQNLYKETGSSFDQRLQVPDRGILPENISVLVENAPSASSTSFNRPPSLPLSAARYPFGLYPPPFVPHLLPNTPPSGFPLSFLQPRNVQSENILADALRSSPVTPEIIRAGVVTEILPPTENLTPEEQKRIISEMIPKENLPDAESNPKRIPYEFGFNMNDGKGNDQHRQEFSDIAGVVTGSYGYRDQFGNYRTVNYIADERGFRAFIQSNEPGVSSSGSADVVVMAERPPTNTTAEAKMENKPEISDSPDSSSDLTVSGSIAESK